VPTPTVDPDVVILARESGSVPLTEYQRLSTGERWRVMGTCNQCGLCCLGVAEPSRYVWDDLPGRPLAVRDLQYGQRLDEPLAWGFLEDMEEMAQQTPTATVAGCSFTFERR
jgi:hypothetical protein